MIEHPPYHPALMIRRHRFDPKQPKGFTLLEVIAGLALLALLTAIFGMGLVAAMQSHEFNRTNVQIAQKAHLAMNRMSRELMELVDVDEISGDTDDPFIIYRRDVSGRLRRLAIHLDRMDNKILLYSSLAGNITSLDHSHSQQGDVLVDEVNDLELACFKGQAKWTDDDSLDELSTIRITMKLSRPDSPDPAKTEDFSTIVHLRNTRNVGGATFTINPATKSNYSCFISSMGGLGD